MVFRNCQPEGEELCHACVADFYEPLEFGRKHEWRRMSEIHETEVPAWTYFAVQHGCNFSRTIVLAPTQSVSRADGLREPEVNLLKHVRSRFSVPVQFRKHECMKSVVHS